MDYSSVKGFNSKLVRLEAQGEQINLVGQEVSFNSKLVRLKEDTSGVYEVSQGEFQFQTGSIKRRTNAYERWQFRRFQFQTGSIKSERL